MSTAITINAPSGPNVVNAQGVNNFDLVAGFYVGTDGQDHGFMANISSARKGIVTATAIPDPAIPAVAGEPGATFVFSQILAVNDAGIAVGYYGDSTTSQHGFLYNTNTGKYTFLDDPAVRFSNGVEVTQITGITDSGELTGFYTDIAGAAHSFTACPPGRVLPQLSPRSALRASRGRFRRAHSPLLQEARVGSPLFGPTVCFRRLAWQFLTATCSFIRSGSEPIVHSKPCPQI